MPPVSPAASPAAYPAASRAGADADPLAETLERSLMRLGAMSAPEPEGQILRAVAGRPLLAALLDAIDDTVLPQTLRLRNAAGACLLIEAAHRRLLRVRSSADAAGLGDAEVLDPGDTDRLREIGAGLCAFAEGSPALRLVPAGGAPEPAGARGVSVRDLAEAWGVARARPALAPEDLLAETLMTEGDAILAWLSGVEGSLSGEGEPELLDAMRELVVACDTGLLARPLGGAAHGPRDAVARFDWDAGGEIATLFVLRDGVAMVFLTEQADADAIVARLQRRLRGEA
jgi:hypothetical protein